MDYYAPKSTTIDLKGLLKFMPNLVMFSLSFGNLGFFHIPRLLKQKPFNIHIQVRIDKDYYDAVKYKYVKTIWNGEMLDDCVMLSCIKDKLTT